MKKINITPQMLTQIAELDEFKGAWIGIVQLRTEQLKAIKKVSMNRSIGSPQDDEEAAGYTELIKTIFDNYPVIPLTENFIKELHRIKDIESGKADYEPWLSFFLTTLQEHKRRIESKISAMANDDTKLSRNQMTILKLFDNKPEWSSSEIVAELGMNIETVKKNIKALVDSGYLIKYGATKGAWYVVGSEK
jgi:biotin operon repressor